MPFPNLIRVRRCTDCKLYKKACKMRAFFERRSEMTAIRKKHNIKITINQLFAWDRLATICDNHTPEGGTRRE